jgi:hypothetical protein
MPKNRHRPGLRADSRHQPLRLHHHRRHDVRPVAQGRDRVFVLPGIPTLLGASAYSLYKARHLLSAADLPMFTIGTVAAFISAFLCVRWLLRYISSHTFTVFAWYRIAFGLLVLVTGYTGVILWAD